ncbi:Clp protease/crotonase-like domain-containing protein [Prauserella endophytica]|uniref:hypothetical protein n=1 Tax=Prauserella endophytica TaxID=1592324 RepID=UPI000D847646|nr:hypothetical protein [Prauserella endophytica]PXY29283.1 hypothetical protein BAY59_16895 [Prauserella coralliicola]
MTEVGMPDGQAVHCSVQAGITAVTLNRPHGRHALAGQSESNALTKSLARLGGGVLRGAFPEAERVAVALAGHGRDSAEGRAAFLEDREPTFS